MKINRLAFGLIMLGLAVVGARLASLAGLTSPQASAVQIFYWHVLPALPFLGLAALAAPFLKLTVSRLAGAAWGAVAAIAIPYLVLWISLANSGGGGANIGVGLLFLAMPVYLPVFMFAGAAAAGLVREFHSGR